MIRKFANNIYSFELPLNYGPLPTVNCYLIKTPDRSLLIDTGHNTQKSWQILSEGLKDLGIDSSSLDIFLTHGHVDHIGGCDFLAGPDTTVYISEQEYLMTQKLTDREYWISIQHYFEDNGWPTEPTYSFFVETYLQKENFKFNCAVQYLCDGKNIPLAGHSLRTIVTPGHSKQHMSLLDSESGIVFTGDLIMDDFYPTLYYRENNLDMLNLYQESLSKIKTLNATILLPGHRQPIYDIEPACDKAIKHYQKISDKVQQRLSAESGDAFTLARAIYEKIWAGSPLRTKWFFTAGVLSCLESFALNGLAGKTRLNGKTIFFPI